ncbi:hypothetical protein [Cecembia rubra]|uniref:hypothetical protein n=1 Tax=Cecembia rubra TaxID=1485585 RepID=UPI002714EEFB|nr:hypothetical protein [Cecembia rubra]
MNYFSIRTNFQPSIIDLLEGKTNLEFNGLSWHRDEINLGDIAFIVISGDSSKKELQYLNGLRAIGQIISFPEDDGQKHFKLNLKILILFEESLTKDDFYNFPELKNAPNIGPTTTNEPNQAFRKVFKNQAEAIIKAISVLQNKPLPSIFEKVINGKKIQYLSL